MQWYIPILVYHNVYNLYVPHCWHWSITSKKCGSCTTQRWMKYSLLNSIRSKMWLSNWSKYLGFEGSPPHITPFYKINYLSIVALFCQVYNVPWGIIIRFYFSSISNLICTLVWKWLTMASHTSLSIKGHSVRIRPFYLQKLQQLGVSFSFWSTPWTYLLHTHSLGRNMFCQLCLTLDLLFWKTLALVVTFILALITITLVECYAQL